MTEMQLNSTDNFKISDEAKSLIRSLINPKPRKRLTIPKIRSHAFFKSIKWSDVENGRAKRP